MATDFLRSAWVPSAVFLLIAMAILHSGDLVSSHQHTNPVKNVLTMAHGSLITWIRGRGCSRSGYWECSGSSSGEPRDANKRSLAELGRVVGEDREEGLPLSSF